MNKALLTGLLISVIFSVNCSTAKRISCDQSASAAESQAVDKCLEKKNEGKKEKDKIKEDPACSAAGTAARQVSYDQCMNKI
jgi:hypothetical protein